jgi:hypothetical protein
MGEDAGGQGDGGQADPVDETVVEKVVRKVVGGLLGDGPLQVDDAGDKGAKPDEGKPPTLRQEEADMRRQVREELTAVERERAHEADHERLRQAAETGPSPARWVEKMMGFKE